MRLIEMAPDSSVPYEDLTFQLQMTEEQWSKVERSAEKADMDPRELLAEMIHTGSVSGKVRKR